ncbi:hypothetical protein AIG44_24955 [Salmonella enterica subsp. enterica serovar Bredeney]|nr:hypothetical protein [Salmonella enterica subsp. enterica serovar Bredeney]
MLTQDEVNKLLEREKKEILTMINTANLIVHQLSNLIDVSRYDKKAEKKLIAITETLTSNEIISIRNKINDNLERVKPPKKKKIRKLV